MVTGLIYDVTYAQNQLLRIADYVQRPIDYSNTALLIDHREEGRQLLPVASKVHLTFDFNYRSLLGKRSTQEYALYASLKEYSESVKKDLEQTLIIIANSINLIKMHEQ